MFDLVNLRPLSVCQANEHHLVSDAFNFVCFKLSQGLDADLYLV